jgi:hypothetical protein
MISRESGRKEQTPTEIMKTEPRCALFILMPEVDRGNVLPVADASTQMKSVRMRNDEFKDTTSLLPLDQWCRLVELRAQSLEEKETAKHCDRPVIRPYPAIKSSCNIQIVYGNRHGIPCTAEGHSLYTRFQEKVTRPLSRNRRRPKG